MVADGLVELTDVAPTLAELTDEPLAWTNGRSLLPILTGDGESGTRPRLRKVRTLRP